MMSIPMKATIPSENAGSSRFTVVAFTDADGPAFDQAARIALRVPGSELHLVHVFHEEPSPARSRDLIGHLRLYVNEKAELIGGHHGGHSSSLGEAGARDRSVFHGGRRRSHRRRLPPWTAPQAMGGGVAAEKLLGVGALCPVLVASPAPKKPEKHEPTIEPPCPECLRARAVSGGSQWWCERHSGGRRPRLFVPARAAVRIARLRGHSDRNRLLIGNPDASSLVSSTRSSS